MSYDLSFRQTSATTADLRVTYSLGDGEDGSEFFTYYAAKPENVIKETRQLTTDGGRKIQFGIQLRGKNGYGVAWPAV